MHPAAGATEALRFDEKCLAAPRFLLRALEVIDVGENAVPAHDSIVLIAQREDASVEPAIQAVGPAEAMLQIERRTGFDGVLPCGNHSGKIVRVNDVATGPPS